MNLQISVTVTHKSDDTSSSLVSRRILFGLAWAGSGMITLPIAYLLWTDLTGRGQDLGTLAVAVDFAFAGLAGGLVVGLLLTPRGNRFHGFATLSIVLIDAFMLLLTM